MMKLSMTGRRALLCVLSVWLAARCSAADVPQLETQSRVGLSNPEQLESFWDSICEPRIGAEEIPGLVVVVVSNGKLFFAKGYGLADVEHQRPVVPSETLFSVASVSKVFTATALMQLVERNLVNIHDDVNQHLKTFQIDRTYDQPITLAHLLTHTTGLDERIFLPRPNTESEIPTLGQILAREMPPRVLPPGMVSSYGNFNIALAGHVIEEVSGVPFATYMEDQLLQPLGMDRSSFRVPKPEAANLAKGYVSPGRAMSRTYFFGPLTPAAGLLTTGTDMAKFMLAHLEGHDRLLNSVTLQEMHRQQFTLHPKACGVTYGFREHCENGIRALLHDGSWAGFCSRLYLMPEQRVGLFISYNTGNNQFRQELLSQFLDYYFPVKKKPAPQSQVAAKGESLQPLLGTYRLNRIPERSRAKIYSLLARTSVLAPSPGKLTINQPSLRLLPFPRFIPTEVAVFSATDDPLLFQREAGDGQIAFRVTNQGAVTHLFVDMPEWQPMMGNRLWSRVPWHAAGALHGTLFAFAVCLFLSTLVWPCLWLVSYFRGGTTKDSLGGRRARIWAAAVAFLCLAYFLSVGILGLFRSWTIPLWIVALIIISMLCLAVRAWTKNYWTGVAKLHYALVALATFIYASLLQYWNFVD